MAQWCQNIYSTGQNTIIILHCNREKKKKKFQSITSLLNNIRLFLQDGFQKKVWINTTLLLNKSTLFIWDCYGTKIGYLYKIVIEQKYNIYCTSMSKVVKDCYEKLRYMTHFWARDVTD